MKPYLLTLLVVAVYALHQDFWNWKNSTLIGFLPAGLKRYSLKAAESLHRSRHRSVKFMEVKLNRFDPGDLSGILNVNSYLSLALRRNLRWLNAKVAVLKLCVAQPITERVEWRAGHVDVTPMMGPGIIEPISLRRLVVVIGR